MVRLSKRERLFAVGLLSLVTAWALYVVAVEPVRKRIRTLERIIPEKRDDLRTLQAKSAEYHARRRGFESFRARIAAQDPNFQLPSYLETLVEKQGLTKHVVTMTPNTLQLQGEYSETIVGIELQDLSLAQLLDFLEAVETSDVFAEIGSLHIYRAPESGALLNVTVQIHTPQFNENAVAADAGPRS